MTNILVSMEITDEHRRLFEQCVPQCEWRFSRRPTDEEIAAAELSAAAPESLQQETAEGLTLGSTLGTDSPEGRMVEHIALREAIDQLPEREKMTILLRFFKGLTQEQTARILGVSQVQISRLERRGLADLRRLLDG